MRTRPNAFSKNGVVSSSSLQSSTVGARVLESGGNIVDAAIATSATLCVTQNNLCSLGGDTFMLLKIDGKPVVNLNGSGRAFESMTIEHFLEKGIKKLPSRGKDSVITVPGLVRAWEDIHKKYGTMEISDLMNYAYKYASEGFPITQNYSNSIESSAKYLSGYENWRSIFLRGNAVPEPGTVFKQKDLAETFADLKSDGLSSFYDGHLADKIVNGLNDLGVEISSDDLRKHKSTFQPPLKTEYRGYTVYETAPNSQAATVILWLNMLDLKESNPDLRDILETGHMSYLQRDKFIADPDFYPLPENFLTKQFASELYKNNKFPSSAERGFGDRGDTTFFSITDTDGNSISVVQSNYLGFGSGIVPSGTGFVLQNRGSYFSLDPHHHNALKPGKRTFHTLCAAIIEDDSGYIASIGSMGGDIQPQLHIQLMMGLMNNRKDPQSVIDAPRWAFPYTIYEIPNTLMVESEDFVEEIKKIYPAREVKNVGISPHLGQAQISVCLPDGVAIGGSDSRGDGISIPID
ncbi:MAG: gamma-glutamyltransferase family protein [Candidatus Thermoplasmatota archaeon]|nr:gamma-glutamyltransferase family protein [Candidatus Thermoplasmatota archaeon]